MGEEGRARIDVMALDEALVRLAALDAQQSIVEMRFLTQGLF